MHSISLDGYIRKEIRCPESEGKQDARKTENAIGELR